MFLEAIPLFIFPEKEDFGTREMLGMQLSWIYVVIAASGLVINLIGTVTFACTFARLSLFMNSN